MHPTLIDVIDVAGNYGIPADADMVAATVTSVNPDAAGWIRIYACDENEPPTVNLNYGDDQIANNLFFSRIAADGTICVATSELTDYVIDIAGYVPAGSAITSLPSPKRVVDTRKNIGGQFTSPLPNKGVISFDVPNTSDATVAIFNLAAVSIDAGFAAAYACGTTPPRTSSINFGAGQIISNVVVAKVGDNGRVCVKTNGRADYVVDVIAYATDGITTLASPKRILDTRKTSGPTRNNQILRLNIRDHAPGATNAFYNIASVGATGPGFATGYPCNITRPNTSNVNYQNATAVSAGATTKLAPNGNLCIHTETSTNIIIDLIAYTTNTTHYTPTNPTRALDTRKRWQPDCDWRIYEQRVLDVSVVNIRTNEVRELARPDPRFSGSGFFPTISADCESVIWFGEFGGVGSRTRELVRIDIAGGHERIPVTDWIAHRDIWASFVVGETDDGRYVMVHTDDGRVYDVLSGDLIVAPGAHTFTLSTDGTFTYLVGRDSGYRIVTVDLTTGDQVASFELDSSSIGVEADLRASSGSGNYLLFTGIQTSLGTFTVVFTISGGVVDVVDETGVHLDYATFWGEGTVIVCVNGSLAGQFRWNLHNSLTFLQDGCPPTS